MTKKRVPGFLYNNDSYRYPMGLSITNELEYDEMLDSGKWLEGPGEPSGEATVLTDEDVPPTDTEVGDVPRGDEERVFTCPDPDCDFETEHEASLTRHVTMNHKED